MFFRRRKKEKKKAVVLKGKQKYNSFLSFMHVCALVGRQIKSGRKTYPLSFYNDPSFKSGFPDLITNPGVYHINLAGIWQTPGVDGFQFWRFNIKGF